MSNFVLTTAVNARPTLLVPLTNGVYRVGRDRSCEIIIGSRSVSRRHARITVDGGEVVVTDLGSRNGTFIDSTRITHGRLYPGQSVRFGSVQCQVMPAGSGSLDSESEETGGPEPEQQDRAQAILQRLTRCQRRVATCLLDGDCEKVIASKLSVSVHTVHTHIRAIYSRLGVHSRAELLIRLMGEEGQRRANNAAPSR